MPYKIITKQSYYCLFVGLLSKTALFKDSYLLKLKKNMSWGETLTYITVGNPISQAVLTSASAVLKGAVSCYRNNLFNQRFFIVF